MPYEKLKDSNSELMENDVFIEDIQPSLHKNSTRKSFFLLFKAFIGTGVLFLPRAFANAGLIPSILMMSISAYLSAIGMDHLAQVSLLHGGSYWDLGSKLYGNKLKVSILWSIFLSQLGFAMCYVLFVAQNIRDMLSTFSNCKLQFDGYLFLIAVQLLVYIPFCFFDNLKKLSKAIVFASALIGLGVIYILTNSLINISINGVFIHLFTDWTDAFLILGTAIYSFEGIGLVIPIATSMQRPHDFSKILHLVIISVMGIYFSVAIIGSLSYGEQTATIILLNMEATPFLLIVQGLYVVSILLSVPLQLFPAYEIAATLINPHNNLVIRIATTVFVCLGAYIASSSLDLLVSFIGTIGCIPIGFIYPAILHLKLGNLTKTQKTLNYTLICAGAVFMLVSGVITLYKWTADVPKEVSRCQWQSK